MKEQSILTIHGQSPCNACTPPTILPRFLVFKGRIPHVFESRVSELAKPLGFRCRHNILNKDFLNEIRTYQRKYKEELWTTLVFYSRKMMNLKIYERSWNEITGAYTCLHIHTDKSFASPVQRVVLISWWFVSRAVLKYRLDRLYYFSLLPAVQETNCITWRVIVA